MVRWPDPPTEVRTVFAPGASCYCGPPTFGRREFYQMCLHCISAECRFGERCRTGRKFRHPFPYWVGLLSRLARRFDLLLDGWSVDVRR